jgi:predicted nucleic acid-binding protein
VIVLDTNVISETFSRRPNEAVMSWLKRFDVELAVPSVSIAEISYGIEKLQPEHRPERLKAGLAATRQRFVSRILAFDEEAALAFGKVVGALSRNGRGMSPLDGMIAAIAMVNGGRLATRNVGHFADTGLTIINPWNY